MIGVLLALLPARAEPPQTCSAALETRAEPLVVELVLHRGEGVPDGDVERAADLLSERAGRFGIGLKRSEVPVDTVPAALIGTSPAAGTAPLAPLTAFLDSAARPREGRVHLVVLRTLVDPRSRIAATLSLEGFGLHPDAVDTPHGRLIRTEVGEAGFDPFVLVDSAVLEDPARAQSVLFHELGHALGLPHVATEGNAMNEARRTDCLETLDAAQLAALSL